VYVLERVNGTGTFSLLAVGVEDTRTRAGLALAHSAALARNNQTWITRRSGLQGIKGPRYERKELWVSCRTRPRPGLWNHGIHIRPF